MGENRVLGALAKQASVAQEQVARLQELVHEVTQRHLVVVDHPTLWRPWTSYAVGVMDAR